MRLVFALVFVVLATELPMAQDPSASPSSPAASSSQDAPASPPVVSLEHIRRALKKPVRESLLNKVEIPADFRIEILEQEKIDEMLSKLDFKSSPAPAGGLYGYEQQRRLFNPTTHPLMQPYAAFSGGELLTIAIQNLIARYAAGPVVAAVKDALHDQAEEAARDDVDRAIAEYCASRPDRGGIKLCTDLNNR